MRTRLQQARDLAYALGIPLLLRLDGQIVQRSAPPQPGDIEVMPGPGAVPTLNHGTYQAPGESK